MGRDMEKYNEHRREYYKKNREKILERQRKWKEENREKCREYGRKWAREHKEDRREYYQKNKERFDSYRKQYYQEHKEEMYKSQQKYIAKNRAYVTKLVVKKRKENAELFKAQGQMYCFLPKTERQNKMVQKLCRIRGVSEEESRKLLEENNWNIKSLIEITYEIYDENKIFVTKCAGKKKLSEFLGCSISRLNHLLKNQGKELIRVRNQWTKQWNYFIEV